MTQLPLPLAPACESRFETYLPGPNRGAVHQLAAEVPPREPVYLWGPTGCGKTHLLQALAAACAQRGLQVGWFGASQALPWPFDPAWAIVVFDDVGRFDEQQQHAAFALCVEAQSHGRPWVAAATVPPVDLPLREDLRSRLGWGQVHALVPLGEEETLAALGTEAERRGIGLPPEVLRYLMTRFSRDLANLVRLLDRLDAYSLSRGRPVTLPLLRQMLSDMPADGPPAAARRAESQEDRVS